MYLELLSPKKKRFCKISPGFFQDMEVMCIYIYDSIWVRAKNRVWFAPR